MKLNNLTKLRYILVIQLFLLQLLFESCREDIVPPGTSLAPINQPVTVNDNDYYSFDIDAQKVSFHREEHPLIRSSNSKLSIKITAHPEGRVSIQIIAQSGAVLYIRVFTSNSYEINKYIQSQIPEKVIYDFENFSGTLNLQITGS